MNGFISGTGSYILSHVMDNNGIAGLVDTNDEWIRERTGIVRRHIIKDETTVSMAVEACTGFVLAYNTAMAYVNAGVYRSILVIGSESLSTLTNWKDRGTCILFGDGAGAAVIQSGEGKYWLPVTHSAGEKGGALTCRSRNYNNGLTSEPSAEHMTDETHFISDGRPGSI